MAEWDNRIRDHAIQGTLGQYSKVLDSIDVSGENVEDQEKLDRLKQVIEWVTMRLRAADPALTPLPTLNGANTHLTRSIAHLRNYPETMNAAKLNDAVQEIENVLAHGNQIPVPVSITEVEGLGEIVRSVRASAVAFRTYIRKDKAELRKALKELNEEVDNRSEMMEETLNAKLETKSKELDQRFSDLNERITQAQQTITTQTGQLQEALGQYQKQFSEAQEKRRDAFEDLQKEFRASWQEIQDREEERVKTISSDLGTKAEEEVQELERLRDQAIKLVGVIGSTGMSAGYQEAASDEIARADNWRKIATGSVVTLFVVGLWAYVTTSNGTFEWGPFAAKLVLTTPLVALAAYAISESHRHRKAGVRLRRKELEFASIGTYIEELAPERRAALKERLADRWFAQPDGPDGGDKGLPTGSLKVVQGLIDSLQRLIGKL